MAEQEILEKVTKDGYALAYASESDKLNKVVVLAAVKQNGRALYYASPVMQDDSDVVLEAVSQCWGAIEYASNRLKEEIIQSWIVAKKIKKNFSID
jgi:endonuclease YncB( thermonuclease family)